MDCKDHSGGQREKDTNPGVKHSKRAPLCPIKPWSCRGVAPDTSKVLITNTAGLGESPPETDKWVEKSPLWKMLPEDKV